MSRVSRRLSSACALHGRTRRSSTVSSTQQTIWAQRAGTSPTAGAASMRTMPFASAVDAQRKRTTKRDAISFCIAACEPASRRTRDSLFYSSFTAPVHACELKSRRLFSSSDSAESAITRSRCPQIWLQRVPTCNPTRGVWVHQRWRPSGRAEPGTRRAGNGERRSLHGVVCGRGEEFVG